MHTLKANRFIVLLFSLLIIPSLFRVRAGYVLPYPSYMPGHTFYKISRVFDTLSYYWHWGNIARVKYSLKTSDKYLVEAKTLFEYKQYLLAHDALSRSDARLENINNYLTGAVKQGKDIGTLKKEVAEAMTEHIRILDTLESALPDKFVWKPEKAPETELAIRERLMRSKILREAVADDTAAL